MDLNGRRLSQGHPVEEVDQFFKYGDIPECVSGVLILNQTSQSLQGDDGGMEHMYIAWSELLLGRLERTHVAMLKRLLRSVCPRC